MSRQRLVCERLLSISRNPNPAPVANESKSFSPVSSLPNVCGVEERHHPEQAVLRRGPAVLHLAVHQALAAEAALRIAPAGAAVGVHAGRREVEVGRRARDHEVPGRARTPACGARQGSAEVGPAVVAQLLPARRAAQEALEQTL